MQYCDECISNAFAKWFLPIRVVASTLLAYLIELWQCHWCDEMTKWCRAVLATYSLLCEEMEELLYNKQLNFKKIYHISLARTPTNTSGPNKWLRLLQGKSQLGSGYALTQDFFSNCLKIQTVQNKNIKARTTSLWVTKIFFSCEEVSSEKNWTQNRREVSEWTFCHLHQLFHRCRSWNSA